MRRSSVCFLSLDTWQRLIMQVVRGDLKKAMERLRGCVISKTHHFSTFRSGILLGLALPLLASGIYHSAYLVS